MAQATMAAGAPELPGMGRRATAEAIAARASLT
jgi:hypothetical protein